MTITLSQSGVEYMTKYADKHDHNRSEALDTLVRRYRSLMTFAKPAALDYEQFRMLAQLADGLVFSADECPKTQLLNHVTGRLRELQAFERDMAQSPAAKDTPQERQKVSLMIEEERSRLLDLHPAVEHLSELQSMVMIEAIEDLYSREGDPEALCTEIFSKLWPIKYQGLGF